MSLDDFIGESVFPFIYQSKEIEHLFFLGQLRFSFPFQVFLLVVKGRIFSVVICFFLAIVRRIFNQSMNVLFFRFLMESDSESVEAI